MDHQSGRPYIVKPMLTRTVTRVHHVTTTSALVFPTLASRY